MQRIVKDLKDSLNLPKTNFPMRANLVAREPQRIAHWEKNGLYEAIQKKNAANRLYVLHDGPPFTNGDVHIGTALNKILKDVILRYKSMRGYRTPYIPGWDCHGLPIEHKVANALRDEGKRLSISELRDACADFSLSYIERQRTQFKRLGVLADWAREYRTLDPEYEADILRTFAVAVEKGFVYRDKKPVYWSIPCETALAEAEIEYRDHVAPSIWVAFRFAGQTPGGVTGPVSAVIWTTTPWTIPANLAVAVHPDLEYSVIEAGGTRYLVAATLVERFAADCGLGSPRIIKTARGRELEGIETRHPFIDRPSPIVLAEYVTTDSGTGCVHIAPGHGLDDCHTGMRYKLPIYSPLDDKGRYVADGQIPDDLVGASVLEINGKCPANEKVLAKLRAVGALIEQKTITHSYPHCWRSKTPVVFRAMDQWFISMDKSGVRQAALEAIGKVKWTPDWGQNRIRGAVEARPDWCISRQRSWGVPIPVFYDAERRPLLDAGVIRGIAEKVALHGTQYWFEHDAATLLQGIDLPEKWRGRELAKGADTLDVWFESGISHLAILKRRPGLNWPAELYLEGSDQHRGWFQHSLLLSVIAEGDAPFKEVLTHGFVVGPDGRKISKSEGKPQSSDYFVGKFGSDVVRLWVASIDFRHDVPISEEILQHVSDTYRTLRNTLRFQISNLFDFSPTKHAVSYDALDPIDRWALHQAGTFTRQATEAYDNFEFHRVYQLCNQFCTVTLSAIYHDLLKDSLYTLAPGSHRRRSAQTTVYEIFSALSRALAPILAFTTDEAWGFAFEEAELAASSIHIQDWPLPPAQWRDESLAGDIDRLLAFRDIVNDRLEDCRQRKEIGKSLDAEVTVAGRGDHPIMELLEKYASILPELFIVSKVQLQPCHSDEPSVVARHASGERCPRCWRWVPAFKAAGGFEVCPRCSEAL